MSRRPFEREIQQEKDVFLCGISFFQSTTYWRNRDKIAETWPSTANENRGARLVWEVCT
jgi:hypothetical protein